MDTIKAIIFDGDDTLWECGTYYRDAEHQFVVDASARTGISKTICRNVLQFVDGQLALFPNGFAKERFPQSFQASALALEAMANNIISEVDFENPESSSVDFAYEMYKIGYSVYNQPYPLYGGVLALLSWLQRTNVSIILNTKGADDVQNPKIDDNNIRSFFDGIYVTLKKDEDHLQHILDQERLNPKEVLSVGDSMVDDISVPRALGCKTVWISDHSSKDFVPSWDYEKQLDNIPLPNWWTPSVTNLPEILEVEPNGDMTLSF